MKEKKDRNQEVIEKVQELVDFDVKRPHLKVATMFGISERRVFAIINKYNKKGLEND